MSDKVKKDTTETQEKVKTSYDRKMERRRLEKEREKRERTISIIVAVVIVVALIGLVASFPIRKYIAANEVYVTVNGEDITKPEFDYNYKLTVNDYLTQYSSYLSYFGLDTTKDFSEQMYSENMTWQDNFEEMTVENLKNSKALKAQADANGFTYDASKEIESFQASLKKGASDANMSVKDYLKELYGDYATVSRVSAYMEEALRGSAYYDEIAKEKAPSDDAIQTYYNEHPNDYDSVDYYQTMIVADLPTEPTELADPVDEENADATDTDEDTPYQPSEAEIMAAMDIAMEDAYKVDPKDGELMEDMQSASVSYLIRDWLFDGDRKEGDHTVIEDSGSSQFYVLSFIKRYLKEEPTVDARVILSSDIDGETVLSEWRSGAATEDSFEELYEKYKANTAYTVTGGLLEGLSKTAMEDVLADWLFAQERVKGDVTSIKSDTGYTYVLYYVGVGNPEWKNEIKNTLLNETMTAYMDEISSGITVEDKHGKLNYLKVRAEEEASAEGE